jgi:hypothetical protein
LHESLEVQFSDAAPDGHLQARVALDHVQQLGFAKAQFPHQAVNDIRLPGGNARPKNPLC